MANQLFEVSGISLDGTTSIIYGSGVPAQGEGNSIVEANLAKVGSTYSNIQDGSQWQKVTEGSGSACWVELAGKEAAKTVKHVASTGIIIDLVPTQLVDQFAWMVTAVNEADPTNKWSAIIDASHNGTATLDATDVKYGMSSVLRQGAKINGLSASINLSGTGSGQFMNLSVSSLTMCTFTAYRMVKNVAGSTSVILSESALASHVIDGSVHMTPSQNTLLDGLSLSLTSTQVNTLVGVTGAIQTQLDSKPSSAEVAEAIAAATPSGLATVATTGSYTDLINKPAAVTSVTGNAGTATALETARTISLTGAVTGSVSFNGTANVAISTTLVGDTVGSKSFTGAVTCNYTNDGSYIYGTVVSATTLTITGVPDATKAYGMTFEFTNAGTNITWPASVIWLGSAPTLRASGVSIVTLVTRNGGTTWHGSAA